jgi:hypothetical protein
MQQQPTGLQKAAQALLAQARTTRLLTLLLQLVVLTQLRQQRWRQPAPATTQPSLLRPPTSSWQPPRRPLWLLLLPHRQLLRQRLLLQRLALWGRGGVGAWDLAMYQGMMLQLLLLRALLLQQQQRRQRRQLQLGAKTWTGPLRTTPQAMLGMLLCMTLLLRRPRRLQLPAATAA